jgi:hypothetical protein
MKSRNAAGKDQFVLKPGQPITDLPPVSTELILNHPAQRENLIRIAELISLLRAAETWADLNVFQRHLFKEIYQAQERRAECSWMVKRHKRGQQIRDDISPPYFGQRGDLSAWLLEEYIYERVTRQLRTVGDALAWRSFGYYRPIMAALSFNSAPGPMVDKEGLDYELGRLDYLWREKGHFGLLHDLTNFLRMADITEFFSQTKAEFHEVKKSIKISKAQLRRLQMAIDSVMQGGVISDERPDVRFLHLKQPHRTNLKSLDELIQAAKEQGSRGLRLSSGRVLVVISLLRQIELFGSDPERGVTQLNETRQEILNSSGFDSATHTIRSISGDMASRSVSVPPMSIYPFSPEDCAALICDFIVFETLISVEMLVDVLEAEGISARIELAPVSGTLGELDTVIVASLGNRSAQIHPPGLLLMQFELLEPEIWAKGIHEILTDENASREPLIIFSNEATTWEGEGRSERFWRATTSELPKSG